MARPISKNELFSDIIGKCYIKMMLDVRNQKRVESNDKGNRKFPLCIRFVMGDRYYFRLGEEYSEDEVARIMASTGQGEERRMVLSVTSIVRSASVLSSTFTLVL